MLPIAQICDQYAWLYTDLPVPSGTWDHILPTDGSYVAVKRVGDTDYVHFRGSVTALDWLEDFFGVVDPLNDPHLGPIHPGFYLGVRAVKERLDALVGDKVVIVGHSLGAGHATLYAGYRQAAGKPVDQVVMFGEPRAGMARLAAVLEPVPIQSFCNQDSNGHDLVTNVPASFPPFLLYQHPRPLTPCSATPPSNDKWGLFRYHHFGLYCKALGASGTASVSLPGYPAVIVPHLSP